MKLGDLQPQICPHMWKLVDLSSLKNKHLLSLVFPFHLRLPTAYKWILLCNQTGGKLAFYLFINSPEQILHAKAHFLFFFLQDSVVVLQLPSVGCNAVGAIKERHWCYVNILPEE